MKKIFLLSLLLTFLIIGVIYSAPDTSPRYKDNEDHTIIDYRTGLMWQKCNYGQQTEAAGACGATNTEIRNWTEALTYCEGLTLNADSDWRLPDVNELFSIYDLTKTSGHAIDETFFSPAEWNLYWTSTTRNNSPDEARIIDFEANGNSYTRAKSSSAHVRCVRGL